MPVGCTNKGTIDAINSTVGTINTNVSNLAIAYAKVSVAPDLAAAKAVATATTAWITGAASSTILTASSNTIVGIHIEQISAADTYQVNLYASAVLCGSAVFARKEVTVMDTIYIPFRSQKVTGAITAKLASATGGGKTAAIKLNYV